MLWHYHVPTSRQHTLQPARERLRHTPLIAHANRARSSSSCMFACPRAAAHSPALSTCPITLIALRSKRFHPPPRPLLPLHCKLWCSPSRLSRPPLLRTTLLRTTLLLHVPDLLLLNPRNTTTPPVLLRPKRWCTRRRAIQPRASESSTRAEEQAREQAPCPTPTPRSSAAACCNGGRGEAPLETVAGGGDVEGTKEAGVLRSTHSTPTPADPPGTMGTVKGLQVTRPAQVHQE